MKATQSSKLAVKLTLNFKTKNYDVSTYNKVSNLSVSPNQITTNDEDFCAQVMCFILIDN